MKILIVEDERPIANYIEKMIRKILGDKVTRIKIIHHLDQAFAYLADARIDLCLLDLNLHGENGYEILKRSVAGSFHTIIISANTDKALEAFEYGVLDFVGKPFTEDRLKTAFNRFLGKVSQENMSTKYLSLRKGDRHIVIPIENVTFFKAAGIYVEAHLYEGKMEILDKTMERLEQILPGNFMRVHRSYIIDISQIVSFSHTGGGKYQVTVKTGKVIPLSRSKYKILKELIQ